MRPRALAAFIFIIALGSVRAGDAPATVEDAVARLSSALAAADTGAARRVFLKVYAAEYGEVCAEGQRALAAKRAFTAAMNAHFPCQHEEELPGPDARSLADEMRATSRLAIASRREDGAKVHLVLAVSGGPSLAFVAAREDGGWKLAPEGHDQPLQVANYAALRLAYTAALYEHLAQQVVSGRFRLRDDAIAAAESGWKSIEKTPPGDMIVFREHPESLELRWLFQDLLDAARAKDEAQIARAAGALRLPEPSGWLARVFGDAPERATKECEREQAALAMQLAAAVHVASEKGWTQVRVARVAKLPRMKSETPLYSVRLTPPGDSYDGRTIGYFAKLDLWRYVGGLETWR